MTAEPGTGAAALIARIRAGIIGEGALLDGPYDEPVRFTRPAPGRWLPGSGDLSRHYPSRSPCSIPGMAVRWAGRHRRGRGSSRGVRTA